MIDLMVSYCYSSYNETRRNIMKLTEEFLLATRACDNGKKFARLSGYMGCCIRDIINASIGDYDCFVYWLNQTIKSYEFIYDNERLISYYHTGDTDHHDISYDDTGRIIMISMKCNDKIKRTFDYSSGVCVETDIRENSTYVHSPDSSSIDSMTSTTNTVSEYVDGIKITTHTRTRKAMPKQKQISVTYSYRNVFLFATEHCGGDTILTHNLTGDDANVIIGKNDVPKITKQILSGKEVLSFDIGGDSYVIKYTSKKVAVRKNKVKVKDIMIDKFGICGVKYFINGRAHGYERIVTYYVNKKVKSIIEKSASGYVNHSLKIGKIL